jgi:hypothetical protein
VNTLGEKVGARCTAPLVKVKWSSREIVVGGHLPRAERKDNSG